MPLHPAQYIPAEPVRPNQWDPGAQRFQLVLESLMILRASNRVRHAGAVGLSDS